MADDFKLSDYLINDHALIDRLRESNIDQNLLRDVKNQFLLYENICANYVTDHESLLDECRSLRDGLESYKRAIKVLIPISGE